MLLLLADETRSLDPHTLQWGAPDQWEGTSLDARGVGAGEDLPPELVASQRECNDILGAVTEDDWTAEAQPGDAPEGSRFRAAGLDFNDTPMGEPAEEPPLPPHDQAAGGGSPVIPQIDGSGLDAWCGDWGVVCEWLGGILRVQNYVATTPLDPGNEWVPRHCGAASVTQTKHVRPAMRCSGLLTRRARQACGRRLSRRFCLTARKLSQVCRGWVQHAAAGKSWGGCLGVPILGTHMGTPATVPRSCALDPGGPRTSTPAP